MTEAMTLSPNDAMWLNMDTPENLMVIESVMWFDRPLDLDQVRSTLVERMIDRYPIFTWRAVASKPVGLDSWEPMADFDIDDHIRAHDLPGGGGSAELRSYLERQMSIPLDRDRPLWIAHVLAGADFGAVILRTHHAIADGTALARILIDLTSPEPPGWKAVPGGGSAVTAGAATHPQVPAVQPRPTARRRGRRAQAASAISAAARPPLSMAMAATTGAANLAKMLAPERVASLIGAIADNATGTADAVDKLVLHNPPAVRFFDKPGVAKRAGWSTPLDLSDVKALAKANNATVNDVLMAALAGALRRYLLHHGEAPLDVVTMVPVNLRDLAEPLPAHLGNKFALVAVELPLAATDPMTRLALTKRRMDLIKHGPEAMLTFGISHIIGAVGAVTGSGSRVMIDFFSNKAIGVTTNVAGPTSTRYLAGARLEGVLGWVPGAGRQTVGACIFSYDGKVWVGFKTDATVIPDMEGVIAAFDEEIAELLETLPG